MKCGPIYIADPAWALRKVLTKACAGTPWTPETLWQALPEGGRDLVREQAVRLGALRAVAERIHEERMT